MFNLKEVVINMVMRYNIFLSLVQFREHVKKMQVSFTCINTSIYVFET